MGRGAERKVKQYQSQAQLQPRRRRACTIATYLPQEEETKSDFDGGQPHGVEVYHKVHELLGISGDQVDDLAHRACPSGRTVDDQGLCAKKQKRFNSTFMCNSCAVFFSSLCLPRVKASTCSFSDIICYVWRFGRIESPTFL